jgi:beta-galactosidase
MKRTVTFCLCLLFTLFAFGQSQMNAGREHINFDKNWKFALGHASDASKDYGNGTGFFSYLAKTGYGDGAAAANYDDRAWRKLDLPHDWAVELPFDPRASLSHGFKAIGRNFPENSIGWYRKKFNISAEDLGKRITIQFDGVFRNSMVWVNGFYLGTEPSAYADFAYDISDYLNYGGENTIAVRADASMEEGWFYEGAGIYRHVWLSKTAQVHVAYNGTFVTTTLPNTNQAEIKVRTSLVNESNSEANIRLAENITDAEGKTIAQSEKQNIKLAGGETREIVSIYTINKPKLWDLSNPYLHTVKSVVYVNNQLTDNYNTRFGIRTVRFDANEGFFLNGKHLKIVGVNNHQDHAGVGVALPDMLQDYRILRMKEMGCNGIRTSHNPPTPEFLDACDRLGMLVMDENRLMGTNQEHFRNLEKLMKRDRNHPCVVIWSLGNEEWAIEGNIKGARIAKTMQDFAQRLDSSRAFTAAVSGGWDNGIGMATQVMGYNYIVQGNIDEHHKKFPWQAGIGTEESNTIGTRGVYETNNALTHLAATNRMPENVGTESGWQFYAARPFLSGLFYWTGFDYRGEPHPYVWPAVTSQFGLVDLCGFPKDIFYYLQSWWTANPVLHIANHWSWKGKEGKDIPVKIYSNCEQVQLFLNGKNLGKKEMPKNGHLEWTVKYAPGTLMAKGFSKGKETTITKLETAGNAAELKFKADNQTLNANGTDISVIDIAVVDNKGNVVPAADNELAFSLSGPGKIIGIGNGNPSSHEAEKFIETVKSIAINDLKELAVNNLENRSEVQPAIETNAWKAAFTGQPQDWKEYRDSLLVVRGTFELPEFSDSAEVNLFTQSILENQSVYVNGQLLGANIKRDAANQNFGLNLKLLKPGKNTFAVTGQRFRKKYQWDEPNTFPGTVQFIEKAKQWKRKAFNGYAQIIIQSTEKPGEITLKAMAPGLKEGIIKITTK